MTALITGASSGIGLELATIAASKGINLVLVARNGNKLAELKTAWEQQYNISVHTLVCDLAQPHAVDKVAEMLKSENIQPDILMNCAGFGLFGEFCETDIRKETEMIQVNITALTQLTKLVYTDMVKRGSGRILNIASVAGFMPGPLMSVYYASKAYVLSFSQALANEAKGTGVTITTLCPGPTESNFVSNAALEKSMLFKSFGRLPTAKTVAQYGFDCMMSGKTLAIHGSKNRLMVYMLRWLPRKAVAAMVRHVQRNE